LPRPSSASYISPSAGDVPAAANAGPSGQGNRTTGSVQVAGSRGSTARSRSSFSMTSTQAHTISGATAPRSTRNPSAQKSLMDAATPSLGLFPIVMSLLVNFYHHAARPERGSHTVTNPEGADDAPCFHSAITIRFPSGSTTM